MRKIKTFFFFKTSKNNLNLSYLETLSLYSCLTFVVANVYPLGCRLSAVAAMWLISFLGRELEEGGLLSPSFNRSSIPSSPQSSSSSLSSSSFSLSSSSPLSPGDSEKRRRFQTYLNVSERSTDQQAWGRCKWLAVRNTPRGLSPWACKYLRRMCGSLHRSLPRPSPPPHPQTPLNPNWLWNRMLKQPRSQRRMPPCTSPAAPRHSCHLQREQWRVRGGCLLEQL